MSRRRAPETLFGKNGLLPGKPDTVPLDASALPSEPSVIRVQAGKYKKTRSVTIAR